MNPRRVLLFVAVALVAAAVLRLTFLSGPVSESASGTVEATEARLGFPAPGRIERIMAREGDTVRAGDTLAILDRAELAARHAQAEAQLTAARALLAELLAGSRAEERSQAREAYRATSEQLDDARRDLDRVRRLVEAGALSRETLDKARLALQVAEARATQAREQTSLVDAGPRPERVAAQRAAVAQAEAAVRQTAAQLSNAVIIAPFDGRVSVRDREPGETVAAGAPVLTLMDHNDRWVRIYVREDAIGAVRIGQAATITSDTWRDRSYGGEVTFISTRAEFTPRNVQTREERVKLVYAVRVRITGDPNHDLKSGVPADVRLEP
jgi:HlyD family secretion protein